MLFKVIVWNKDDGERIDFDIVEENEIDETIERLLKNAKRDGFDNVDFHWEEY